jgi:hypothetical protein
MPRGLRLLLFYAALLLCLPAVAFGSNLQRSWETTSSFSSFHRFGYDAGGTLDLQISVQPPTAAVYFLMCSEAEMFQNFPNSQEHCDRQVPVYTIRCTVNRQVANGMLNITHFEVPSSDIYRFLISNCGGTSLSVSVTATLLNPDGAQLSTEHLALPQLYASVAGIWLVAVLWWAVLLSRSRAVPLPLQVLLSALAAFGLLASFSGALHWRIQAATGAADALFTGMAFAAALVFQTLLYGATLLVVRGWSITRAKLSTKDFRFLLLPTCLAVSLLMDDLQGGYWVFAVMLLFFMYLRLVFAQLAKNREILEVQHYLAMDHGLPRTLIDQLEKRAVLLARLQLVLLLFALGQMLRLVLAVFLITSFPWLGSSLDLLLDQLLALGLLVLLRPRPSADYQRAEDEPGSEETSDVEAPPLEAEEYLAFAAPQGLWFVGVREGSDAAAVTSL